MRKKDNSIILLKWLIAIVVFLMIFVLGVYYFYINDDRQLEKSLKEEGYTTSSEGAFFSKILTNNTLDEYYDDISNGRNSSYEEYYISKESNDFIKLKMSYQDDVNTSINISSDFETNVIKYNIEVSYNKTHVILEGTSEDNYTCNVILDKNAQQNVIDYYCNSMIDEINIFIQKRSELLNNDNINKRIK